MERNGEREREREREREIERDRERKRERCKAGRSAVKQLRVPKQTIEKSLSKVLFLKFSF